MKHDNVPPLSLKGQALKCVNNEKHVGNMLSNIGDIVNYSEIIQYFMRVKMAP